MLNKFVKKGKFNYFSIFQAEIKQFFSNYAHLNSLVLQSDSNSSTNLVVLHGLLGSLRNFQGILMNKAFKSLVNSHLLDLRNHGKSEYKDTMSYQDLSNDVVNYINEKQLKNIILMGHSLGGKTVIEMLTNSTLDHSLIKGCIIVDVAPINLLKQGNPAMSQEIESTKTYLKFLHGLNIQNITYNQLKSMIKETVKNDESKQNLMINSLRQENKKLSKNLAQNWEWTFNIQAIYQNYDNLYLHQQGLKQYYGKTLVVCGENSNYVPKLIKPEFKKVFPNIDIEKDILYVQNAGHFLHIEKPSSFIKIILNFINSILS